MVYVGKVNSDVVFGMVCDSYFQARENISHLAAEHALTILDIPTALHLRQYSPKISSKIQYPRLDTISAECKGLRNDGRYYEVWHSVGPLAKAPALEFSVVSDEIWSGMGQGKFEGCDNPRIHLDDIKKGYTVPLGTPYTAFIRLEHDKHVINKGYVFYDDFMRDDRILLLAGSLENRETLATMHFGTSENRLQTPLKRFGNTTRGLYDEIDKEYSPMTRLMCFRKVPAEIHEESYGFSYVDRLSYIGRMAAISLNIFEKPLPQLLEKISFQNM